nr:MAG TPA: hypothetical protein [Caudoviricetes sp.]
MLICQLVIEQFFYKSRTHFLCTLTVDFCALKVYNKEKHKGE